MQSRAVDDAARAREALHSLDPGCPRDEWVRIAMAAKAAGIEAGEFVHWSSGGANFKSEKDCLSVWRSINQSGGVTAATLFAMARDAGNIVRPVNGHAQIRMQPKPQSIDHVGVWKAAEPATADHPYIRRKLGLVDGLRVHRGTVRIAGRSIDGALLVPAFNAVGALQTWQAILPDGTKLNCSGRGISGWCKVGGPIEGTVYLVEGIGQAWAAHQATRQPALCCFGWGNVQKVAKAVLDAFPGVSLAIIADVGKEADARAVGAQLGARVVTLPADLGQNGDINDLHRRDGLQAVADLLASQPEPAQRYRLMTAGQVAAMPPVRWRIRGAIPEVGVMAFYGASGSGKTFLALDATAAIGSGAEHWFGQRVSPCPVTYLALEGEAGIAQRIRAYVQEHGPIPDRVRFITQPFGLRHMDDIVAVGAAMKAVGAVDGVTVIDTLNRAAGGADENDSRDMSELIEGGKHLQAIVGGVIVLIHHSGKDASKGMRGHSSLIAALDAAIEVNRSEAGRTWKLAKSKDGADGEEHAFALRVVDLGTDEYGDAITSCVVDEANAAAPVRRRPGLIVGKNQKIVWTALQPLFDDAKDFGKGDNPGRPCLKLEQVYEALTPFFPEMDAKRRLARVKDAVEGLVACGRLCCKNEWIWLA